MSGVRLSASRACPPGAEEQADFDSRAERVTPGAGGWGDRSDVAL